MNPLDLHVIHAALYDARRLVRAGIPPDVAVSQVCSGAWVQHRQIVYTSLVNCVALPLPMGPLSYSAQARAGRVEPRTWKPAI